MLIQNFGDTKKSIVVNLKVAYSQPDTFMNSLICTVSVLCNRMTILITTLNHFFRLPLIHMHFLPVQAKTGDTAPLKCG